MTATGIDSKRSWVVATAAFVAVSVVFGIVRSFGVFFDAMAEEFGSGHGATALVFAVTASLYFLLGSVTGPLADRIGPRPLIAFGALSVAAGLIATAAAQTVWMGYLTFGVGVGVGFACVYVPALSTVAGWFERQRTAAIGTVASGGAVGVLVASPISAALIEAIGFRETYVLFGITAAVVLLACAWAIERAPARRTTTGAPERPFSRRALVREQSFVRLWASGGVVSVALFVPSVFIPSYATEHGAGAMHAALLLGAMGGASMVGRAAIGAITRSGNLVGVYRGAILAMTASLALWLVSDGNVATLWVFVATYGVASGILVAIIPAIVAQMFGSAHAGGIMGLVYTSAVLGSLAGTPLSGALIDATGAFEPSIAFVTVASLLAWVIARPIGSAQPAAQPSAAPARA